jgi:5S rRNA maturation endonuclease (ribonuclease M5)
VAEIAPKERYREDIEKSKEYINGLPKKVIRGFDLPFDDRGYYLLWPDGVYYKRRNWGDSGSKYYSPAGHTKPLFVVRERFQGRLFLVEGEINALSIAAAFPDASVISPGSATDFKKYNTKDYLTLIRYYSTVIVCVDYDGPGAEAAIYTKGALLGKGPKVQIALMKKDANQVLNEAGKEELRAEVERALSSGL